MRYYAKVTRTYNPGDIIFAEGSECDGMYVIDSGRVRIFRHAGPGADSSEVDLCTLGAKSMFGEMAMIDEDRRSATVQAIEQTTCTIITKKVFEDRLERIPPWMVNLIKIMVSRLRETNEKVLQMAREVAQARSGAPKASVEPVPAPDIGHTSTVAKPILTIQNHAGQAASRKKRASGPQQETEVKSSAEILDTLFRSLDEIDPGTTASK